MLNDLIDDGEQRLHPLFQAIESRRLLLQGGLRELFVRNSVFQALHHRIEGCREPGEEGLTRSVFQVLTRLPLTLCSASDRVRRQRW